MNPVQNQSRQLANKIQNSELITTTDLHLHSAYFRTCIVFVEHVTCKGTIHRMM